ncbi:MAG: winged helix-turn-helix transcriptional regulator [Bacilli bacterium]|nr:winged helix-turn-helix transcriptional regulator [Bacilli bacterium]MBN2696310.1 winged helix-turn-helix transcriptional regulator [Bacilli bacterium]
MNNDTALLFKALSDENRLKIIKMLIQGETCGCTLIDKLSITQPTLSYHLNILAESGLTKTKKEGVWKKHFVQRELLDRLIDFLTDLKNTEGSCELK